MEIPSAISNKSFHSISDPSSCFIEGNRKGVVLLECIIYSWSTGLQGLALFHRSLEQHPRTFFVLDRLVWAYWKRIFLWCVFSSSVYGCWHWVLRYAGCALPCPVKNQFLLQLSLPSGPWLEAYGSRMLCSLLRNLVATAQSCSASDYSLHN